MKFSRRQMLGLGTVAAVSGCAPFARRIAADLPEDVSLPSGEVEPTHRLANRLSFGPTPGELKRIAVLGHDNHLEEQLAAAMELLEEQTKKRGPGRPRKDEEAEAEAA